MTYLAAGVCPSPRRRDGLDVPYGMVLAARLMIQRCSKWGLQWGPNGFDHKLPSFEIDWVGSSRPGGYYAGNEWAIPHIRALKEQGPYIGFFP